MRLSRFPFSSEKSKGKTDRHHGFTVESRVPSSSAQDAASTERLSPWQQAAVSSCPTGKQSLLVTCYSVVNVCSLALLRGIRFLGTLSWVLTPPPTALSAGILRWTEIPFAVTLGWVQCLRDTGKISVKKTRTWRPS